MEIIVVSS